MGYIEEIEASLLPRLTEQPDVLEHFVG